MLIIGLDISLNSPGWCRIDTDTGARTFDSLSFNGRDGMDRIGASVTELVALCRPADLVVCEGLSMALPRGPKGPFMPQGRYDLIGLTYILRLWLHKNGKRTLLVPPTTLKKFVTDNGNAKKNTMLRAVTERWKPWALDREPEDDDQADAVALAEFGRAYLNPAEPHLLQFQRNCLDKAEVLVP